MIKKVAIIGTVGLPAKYSGFETLSDYLTKYLNKKFEFSVYCSSKRFEQRVGQYNKAKLIYLPLNANGVQSIPYDIISIIHALRYADTLLILGVSGCIFLPFVKFISQKKIVVNIDGLEWKRDKWNKVAKWFLKLSEKSAVKYADIVVSDNKFIQKYVKSEYKIDSELIAYGANHVEKMELSKEVLNKFKFLKHHYAFTVCRIEPENNLHIILEAMAKQTALNLVIIGNWKSSLFGINLRAKYAGFEHIKLLDPIFDQQILNQIRSNCFVYLHGHSAGGTNPSLVEAMYLGLPVFAYGINYNKETTEKKANYFSDVEDLTRLVAQSSEKSLRSMGEEMAEIAKRRYCWEIISEQYANILN